MDNKKLPIKVVMPRNEDIVKNDGNGSVKFFGEVTPALQTRITSELDTVDNYYSNFFKENPNVPAVAKITMKEKAVAKSHKPNNFCASLPIIGANRLNEIYVKVTANGIRKTKENIKKLPSEKFRANLTAIEGLRYISEEEKISSDLANIFSSKEKLEKPITIKIKTFEFNDDVDQNSFEAYFKRELEKQNVIDYRELAFDDKLHFYTTKIDTKKCLKELSTIVGIKHIDVMNHYMMVSSQNESFMLDGISVDETLPESNTIIGIIDSGISESSIMNNFVWKRETYVPNNYQNNQHGTFVASTIQFGNYLNGFESEVAKKYKFFDAIVIPNSNPEYGDIDNISEEDFMDIVEKLMRKYSREVKVWNISLGTDRTVSNQISDLAVFLDYIQEEYNVQIFLSTGNIDDVTKMSNWVDRKEIEQDQKRITVPSDSVRSVSVGAISLLESDESLSKLNDPSPFSRCGPGANYILKPDLVDYGGNVNIRGSFENLGVKGLNSYSEVIEDVGTSFSAPRVTKKYVDILDELDSKDLLLAKALLIHSAKINSKNMKIPCDKNSYYYGFGLPFENASEILNCSENEVTLMFTQKVIPGIHLEMDPFPFPDKLLFDEKYKGEIFMTLAYNPPLNEKFGNEYCRTNIDVSFGQYNVGEKYKGEVNLEKRWVKGYEKEQVENGFKWASIKSYYKKMTKLSAKDFWKIRVDLTTRNEQIPQEQPFVLIVTLRDLNSDEDIYTDIVMGLRSQGYVVNDLQTRVRANQGKLGSRREN